jgi:hypothetical protein
MAVQKTAASVATKWSQHAQGAGADYVAGAVAAASTQAANAIAQASSWLTGVTQAGTKAFVAGIEASQSTNKYASRVQAVGNARFTSGVSTAQGTFQTAIGKVLSVEYAVVLSPKGPKGSAANQLRSTEMQTALRQAKVNGQFK